MLAVVIDELRKTFRGVEAVRGISLSIEPGTVTAIVGPSGCGKSTTLRCVAGLETFDAGEITIGNRLVAAPSRKVFVPPEKRGLGMVFQSYAVWPHMRVSENIAFGLRVRSRPRVEIREAVRSVVDLLGLNGLEDRLVGQLSGGQQQRVALARALAYQPSVLLLDEPLSNLDATLRERMRFDLRDLQKRTSVTMLYVTHDQQEAFVIADRIAVMRDGIIEQAGTAAEIYYKPSTAFVARFVGNSNFVHGTALESAPAGTLVRFQVEGGPILAGESASDTQLGDKIVAAFKCEDVQATSGTHGASNAFSARVASRFFLGDTTEIRLRMGEHEIIARSRGAEWADLGSNVQVALAAGTVRCYPAEATVSGHA